MDKQAEKNNAQPDEKNKSSKQMNPTEMDQFTSELAKKITKLNQKKQRKSRFFGINPFVLIITMLMAVFLAAGMANNQQSNAGTIQLNDLLAGLKNDRFSELTIQNDGGVVAKEKSVIVTDEIIQINQTEGSSVKLSGIENSANLEEISIEEFAARMKPVSLLDQIRSIFRNDVASMQKIVIGGNFVIGIMSGENKDVIIQDVTSADFTRKLSDNGVELQQQSIPILDLNFAAQVLPADSFEKRVDQEIISNIIKIDSLVIGILRDREVKNYNLDWTPSIYTFTDILVQSGFDLTNSRFAIVTENVSPGVTLDSILTILTIGGFVFLGFVIFRSAQASGMGIMQFGQSKAKMFFGKKTDTSFKDVAGIDEAREELNEIVDFLKNPNKYRKMGARIPKGILMFGPPGTGKTLLARAIAGEAGVPFFHTSGSEFEEMLVGAGASRVRDLFAKAKKAAPSLIFIDEIDAVARKRGTRVQSGSTEQTLNQILVEMDGFEKHINVIVIAATNRPDVLDPAILRPGRFDRQVRIEAPDKDGRVEILQIHAKNKPLAPDVDLQKIAKRTVGFTGADLENIMNESAIIAAKAEQKEIKMTDIDDAVSKVVLGPAKKSRKRTDDELKLVAYHEAGHALVAKYTEKAIPVDKISIVSRGSSGGVTMFLPENDENIISMKRLIANIRVSLGGRAAEEVVLGDISTGASNDIEKATRTAKAMIQKYGMSKDLGLVQYGQSSDSEFLGYQYGESKDYSEQTAEMIDSEVREIIKREYAEAINIITTKKDMLDKLANLLLEREVLEKADFDELF
jgi:cell division protease FtsH